MESKKTCPKCQSRSTYTDGGNHACMMCGERWPMEGANPIIVGISQKLTKKCGYCGKEFQTYPCNDFNFCSRSCSNKSRGYVQQKECPACGSIFFPKPQSKKYCSRKCYGLSRSTAPRAEKQIYIPAPPRIKQCGICGASFIAKTAAKFCEVCREPERLRKVRETWKTEKYKEAHRRAARAWQKNNASKYHAATLVKSHPERINIIYECSCPAPSKHHHHHDYSKPYDVLKLCDKCHMAEHARLRALTEQSVAIG